LDLGKWVDFLGAKLGFSLAMKLAEENLERPRFRSALLK